MKLLVKSRKTDLYGDVVWWFEIVIGGEVVYESGCEYCGNYDCISGLFMFLGFFNKGG